MPNDLPAPPPSPAADGPATLDRPALERVLARAAELQAGQAEPSDGMSENQLVALGRDVGIAPEQIRQALAEERTRVALPDERGVVGGMFGASMITASRIVRGSPPQLLAELDQWMQRKERLGTKRRMPERLTWEARRGLSDAIQTRLNFEGRPYVLRSANEVGATVVAIDAERSIVRLDADFSDARRRRVGVTAVVGGGLLASAVGLIAFTLSVPGASTLVGGVVGAVWTGTGGAAIVMIAAQQRKRMERAQLSLEQVLDRLEHREATPRGSALADLIDVVVKRVDGRR